MTAFILTALLSVSGADRELEKSLDQKIAAARDKAIAFLKKQQEPNGHWEQNALNILGMEGGPTALVALALLEAGVPAKDQAVARAVDYLVQLEPQKTYASVCRSRCWLS